MVVVERLDEFKGREIDRSAVLQNNRREVSERTEVLKDEPTQEKGLARVSTRLADVLFLRPRDSCRTCSMISFQYIIELELQKEKKIEN